MTKRVMCGDVPIGGGAPISIQSMTNTDTRDIRATVEQIARLTDRGCQIVRCAVPDEEASSALGQIKRQTKIPLVADIHFDYRLAISAIENGADKIRINPGNIGDEVKVKAILSAARERGIPIRIGVNAGSLEREILQRHGKVTPEGLAESAVRAVEYMEQMNFDNIVLSIKASDVRMNFEACRRIASLTDHPLHIGVTESGTIDTGKIRSAVGLGALLLCGIGDTIRVSLTGDPVEEVICAKEILKSLGMYSGGISVISCPTCGRTQVDLEVIAAAVEEEASLMEPFRSAQGLPPLTIAVMGCAVNGPGEARDADLGVACGKGKGVIFQKGKPVATVHEENIVGELMARIKGFEKGAKR
ncbi:MAG: flavodoxin-dependent (E)-4-hydroxy-3-methylbut-2-enyl-diphosphate synthase [Anaerovoracaceae bacterium]|jgi:(E)-4-hydroxy-3-methylbut-2-enyl-diphosphate synthase